MAENNSETLKCRFHDQESYKFYCKQCKECICFQCIEDRHEDHTFCRLKSAENDIRTELMVVIEDSKKENCKSIKGLQKTLLDMNEDLGIAKAQLTSKIEDATNTIILKLNESKQKALNSLNEEFGKREALFNKQTETLEWLSSRFAEVDAKSMDLTDIIEMVTIARTTFNSIENLTTRKTKPMFVGNDSDVTVGRFTNLEADGNSSGFQENCNNYADAQVMKIVGNKSSDEESEHTYPMVISDNYSRQAIKIIPVSKNDAWILFEEGNIGRITSNVIETYIHALRTIDFVSLSNGRLLVVRKDDSFIQEVLNDKRIVPFADIGGKEGYIPCTLTMYNKLVFVNIGLKHTYTNLDNSKTTGVTFKKICIFNTDGIQISCTDISSYSNGTYPNLTTHVHQTESETFQCCLFRNLYYQNTSIIHLINYKASEKPKTVATFRGVFGRNPELEFVCFGVCTDKIGNIIVSDYNYKKIYALDKNLKFKSVVLTSAQLELRNPKGVAVYEDILWVADVGKIHKLKYNSQDATLCK